MKITIKQSINLTTESTFQQKSSTYLMLQDKVAFPNVLSASNENISQINGGFDTFKSSVLILLSLKIRDLFMY